MKAFVTALAIAFVWSAVAAAAERDTGERTRDGCRIVETDDSGKGGLSTSVTAGNGKVSAHTSGSGGPSVTVRSGDGTTSSSVATATDSGGTTVVAGSGSGDCVITVPKGQKDRVK